MYNYVLYVHVALFHILFAWLFKNFSPKYCKHVTHIPLNNLQTICGTSQLLVRDININSDMNNYLYDFVDFQINFSLSKVHY